MDSIKLGDLYLPKEESRKSLNFSQKREILKTLKVNRAINYLKLLKNSLK